MSSRTWNSGNAWVTSAPSNSGGMMATQDGRYALVLGEGCAGVVPGVNVLMSTDDAGGLVLQVVGSILGLQDQTCGVVEQEYLDDTPCGKSPAGECDVAWAEAGQCLTANVRVRRGEVSEFKKATVVHWRDLTIHRGRAAQPHASGSGWPGPGRCPPQTPG